MAEEDILSDELVRRLIGVGEVDILVGIHTYNHADTIGPVVDAVRGGLLQYFPRQRVAILNPDGGSRDGTPELVQAATISDRRPNSGPYALRTLHCVSSSYDGGPSMRTALRTTLSAADLLNAKACAVISPDSIEITPEWVQRLLGPILEEGSDLVTPVYRRRKFEGLLVSNLLYPLTRAIYGRPVREPRPREFGLSARLASRMLGHNLWTSEAGREGPEVCVVLTALAENFRLFQTFLGPVGHSEQQSIDLVSALRQTIAPMFWSMDGNFATWSAADSGGSLQTAGPVSATTDGKIQTDMERLRQAFCSGVADLSSVLKSILTPETLEMLLVAASPDDHDLQYSDELWVRVIYEFARAYHQSTISRDHIIQALAPLYRGRAYVFVTDNRTAGEAELEARIEQLCETFENLRPYLLRLWSAPEGG